MWGSKVGKRETKINNCQFEKISSFERTTLNPNKNESEAADIAYLKFEKEYIDAYGGRAAKNDDEAVPVQLWDRAILRNHFTHLSYSARVARALNVIRNKIGFKWYVRCLRRSFFSYMKDEYGPHFTNWINKKNSKKRKRDNINVSLPIEFQKDLNVGRDAIKRAVNITWWEWSSGSTCFFWR